MVGLKKLDLAGLTGWKIHIGSKNFEEFWPQGERPVPTSPKLPQQRPRSLQFQFLHHWLRHWLHRFHHWLHRFHRLWQNGHPNIETMTLQPSDLAQFRRVIWWSLWFQKIECDWKEIPSRNGLQDGPNFDLCAPRQPFVSAKQANPCIPQSHHLAPRGQSGRVTTKRVMGDKPSGDYEYHSSEMEKAWFAEPQHGKVCELAVKQEAQVSWTSNPRSILDLFSPRAKSNQCNPKQAFALMSEVFELGLPARTVQVRLWLNYTASDFKANKRPKREPTEKEASDSCRASKGLSGSGSIFVSLICSLAHSVLTLWKTLEKPEVLSYFSFPRPDGSRVKRYIEPLFGTCRYPLWLCILKPNKKIMDLTYLLPESACTPDGNSVRGLAWPKFDPESCSSTCPFFWIESLTF